MQPSTKKHSIWTSEEIGSNWKPVMLGTGVSNEVVLLK